LNKLQPPEKADTRANASKKTTDQNSPQKISSIQKSFTHQGIHLAQMNRHPLLTLKVRINAFCLLKKLRYFSKL